MDLILAVDLRNGVVVHGTAGARSTYRPLDWGLARTADPNAHLRAIRPRHLYIADLDRIGGTVGHGEVIAGLARGVKTCYVDAGYRSAAECRGVRGYIPVLATETASRALGDCPGGVLSIDCRDGRVIPGDEDPVSYLEEIRHLDLAGHLYLDLGSVGTERGLDPSLLNRLREASDRFLLYGGGVRSPFDLDRLVESGFDGAIVGTAVHRGSIPLDAIRRGTWS
ncbi:MAG: nickel transporter [Methanospirillum sp.]|nr:nickel transporter [Methanospirillum sp.]